MPVTIVSRCQRMELLPVPGEIIEKGLIEKYQVDPEKAKLLSRIAGGCFGWALSAIQDDTLVQQRTEWLDAWREMFDADYDRRFTFAAKLVEKYTQNRSIVQQKLDLLLGWWHDLLLVKADCDKDIVNIDFQEELKKMAAGYSLGQIRAFIDRIQSAKEQLRSEYQSAAGDGSIDAEYPGKETRRKSGRIMRCVDGRTEYQQFRMIPINRRKIQPPRRRPDAAPAAPGAVSARLSPQNRRGPIQEGRQDLLFRPGRIGT